MKHTIICILILLPILASSLNAVNQMPLAFTIWGDQDYDHFGDKLASLDFNGDGYDDLVVLQSWWVPDSIYVNLHITQPEGIYDSIFSSGEIGIVSRGSNQRVTDNKFYTNTGILNHSGSILNMGNLAKNLFEAERENLKFQDTASYTARVQLYEGHNDFYHKNPGLLNPSFDFHFDSNWYVSSPPKSNAIKASYNWFEGIGKHL